MSGFCDGWIVLLIKMHGFCSVVGQMKNPTHGFGEKSAGDETSLKSEFSGETVGGEEKKGERRGSLVKRLFGRKGRGEGEGVKGVVEKYVSGGD